jgi:hypothetical protein
MTLIKETTELQKQEYEKHDILFGFGLTTTLLFCIMIVYLVKADSKGE